jgi:hypothetical protein
MILNELVAFKPLSTWNSITVMVMVEITCVTKEQQKKIVNLSTDW